MSDLLITEVFDVANPIVLGQCFLICMVKEENSTEHKKAMQIFRTYIPKRVNSFQ